MKPMLTNEQWARRETDLMLASIKTGRVTKVTGDLIRHMNDLGSGCGDEIRATGVAVLYE